MMMSMVTLKQTLSPETVGNRRDAEAVNSCSLLLLYLN
jgi:hypothetical protein